MGDFTMLWSLFEASLLGTRGSARIIAEAVRTMGPTETNMGDDRFAAALTHFGTRYFKGDRPTAEHTGLRVRATDGVATLEAVLALGSRDPVEVVSLRHKSNVQLPLFRSETCRS